MKKCENCSSEHDGSYGSGRFCSSKCARGFSTKANRKEINEKVGKKLKENGHGPVEKKCLICNNPFIVLWYKRHQKTCSTKCSALLRWKNKDYIEKMTNCSIRQVISGNRKNSNRSIRCNYFFNNKLIRCDSKIEYSCLNYFENNFDVIDIKRCDIVLSYNFNGQYKKYIPDFIIKTKTDTYIIECKSFFKITEEVKKSKSWSMYYDTIKPKREALKIYCAENNFKEFFYTKELNKKYYNTCKPILND